MVFSELFKDGPVFACPEDVFPPGTDAVALSDFADVKGARNICDIGCGCGVLSVMAAVRNPRASVTAVDISEAACHAAAANVAANGLDDRIGIMCCDIRDHKRLFVSGSFDYIISNPPYFPEGSGKSSETAPQSRQEVTCSLDDIVSAVSYMLKYGGYFAVVHRADRMAEVICALSGAGLEPKVLRLVQYKTGSVPSLVLIKCKKGGKKGIEVMPPLILSNDDGTKSAESARIWEKKWRD